MGRIVRCPIENRTLANADGVLDIFEIVAGANNKLKVHKYRIESDAVAAESVRIRLVRRSTTGTGGVAGVEVKNDEDDGSITGACSFDVTTPGTVGDILCAFRWEQLGPLTELDTPEIQIPISEGGRLCLEVAAAIPTDSAISGFVVWEEI